MSKKNLLLFCLLACTISCNNNEQANLVEIIDISDGLKSKDQKIHLSNIAIDVDYIVLQSDSNCYFDQIKFPQRNIKFVDSLIFISDGSDLFVFNNNGDFIRKIGSKGQGPGEYRDIKSFSILKSDNQAAIYSSKNRSVLLYDLNGVFINTFQVHNKPTELCTINNQLALYHPKGFRKFSEYFTFSLLNTEGKITSQCLFRENELQLENNGQVVGLGTINLNYYTLENKLHHWEFVYDTIWQINEQNEIFPKYYIEYGPNQLPDKYIVKPFISQHEVKDKYIKLFGIVETSRYLFFRLVNKTSLNLIHYDKLNRSCVKPQFLNPSGKGKSFGFYNDVDGGLSYWPHGIVNDQTTFCLISCYNLKQQDKKGLSAELAIIANKVSVYDNPILMIVKHYE